MESPACRESVDEAVETTVSTPRQAVRSDSGSLRSPVAGSIPQAVRSTIFSGELVGRTNALTRSPRSANRRQTSRPRRPVPPTTRIILCLLFAFDRLDQTGELGRAADRHHGLIVRQQLP